MSKVRIFLLGCILVLGAGIRFFQLGSVPPSPDWDEAALGYNAFSVLKTGRDEYGVRFPLVLRSFDDYKPPLYMYLTIPSVAMLGLSTFAVRLPSAILGTSAILAAYLLVTEIFSGHKEKHRYALLTALLLAVSPWHINFSRIAFEANVGLTLNIWAVYLFLRAQRTPVLLPLSAGLFGAALFAYHSERVFVPLMVLFLLWQYRAFIFNRIRISLLSGLVGLVFLIPLLGLFMAKENWTRLSGTSVFADQTPLLERSVRNLEADRRDGDPWGAVFDNRRIVYGLKLAEGYLSHFSLKWLFLTGDNDRHHAPSSGNLYLFELPFILAGMYILWRRGDKVRNLLFFWFFISPIPAMPTTGIPHAIRTLVFLPTFQIFAAVGLSAFMERVRSVRFPGQVALPAGFLLISGFSVLTYLNLYFRHLNREFSQVWQYGYREAVEYTVRNADKYDRVIVSPQLEQPHMFFLFYLKYDPATYLAEGGTRSGGFAEYRNRFGKYEFRKFDWENELHDGRTLYIGRYDEIGEKDTIETIHFLDGRPAIRIGI